MFRPKLDNSKEHIELLSDIKIYQITGRSTEDILTFCNFASIPVYALMKIISTFVIMGFGGAGESKLKFSLQSRVIKYSIMQIKRPGHSKKQ